MKGIIKGSLHWFPLREGFLITFPFSFFFGNHSSVHSLTLKPPSIPLSSSPNLSVFSSSHMLHRLFYYSLTLLHHRQYQLEFCVTRIMWEGVMASDPLIHFVNELTSPVWFKWRMKNSTLKKRIRFLEILGLWLTHDDIWGYVVDEMNCSSAGNGNIYRFLFLTGSAMCEHDKSMSYRTRPKLPVLFRKKISPWLCGWTRAK